VHDDPGVLTPAHPELSDTRDYVNHSGLSRAAIFNAVDASLSRLGTSYIDLFQIHRADFENVTPEVSWCFVSGVDKYNTRYL
jgi:aryl-alcohol dehydrogenase-like predicted oxidoreductase